MDARTDIRDLLAAARRGAPEAIGRLFEVAHGHLVRIAARELPREVRAKIGPSDVVQETAVDMQRDFGRFTGSTAEDLFAWLRAILRNNLVDAVRRYQHAQKRSTDRETSLGSVSAERAEEALATTSLPADGSAIRREEAAVINRALARLPADYRLVIQLRYWSGMSFVAMSPRLGRSPEAVRKLWFRAIESLHAELAAASTATEPMVTTASERH